MAKKIYLSPSSQPANMYAVGNVSEQEMCRKIAAALKIELDRCGFTTYAGMSGTMYTRASESDKYGVDLHLPIHTNACNGNVSGLRIMVNELGGEAEKIAQAIMDTLAPITPGKSDGISAAPTLYEIKATEAICVYLEVGFHDNAEEARWIIDHPNEIAAAIAKGLCNHYGLKYVSVGAASAAVDGFADVPKNAWYADEVAYCVKHGLMVGVSSTEFKPNEPVTRAQLATVAARLHKALNK